MRLLGRPEGMTAVLCLLAGLGPACSESTGPESVRKEAKLAGKSTEQRTMQTAEPDGKRRVIILCTGNSCRSQMAEAFWNRHGGGRWEVVSAGTRPSGRVHPLAVKAMAEKGMDISGQESKSLQPYLDEEFDLVITVCGDAENNCPTFRSGGRHIHRGFDDPPHYPGSDEEKMQVARRVRDEIEAQVIAWIAAEG